MDNIKAGKIEIAEKKLRKLRHERKKLRLLRGKLIFFTGETEKVYVDDLLRDKEQQVSDACDELKELRARWVTE